MNPGFWHVDLGNVATWLTVIFAAAAFILRFSRRIDLLEDSQKSSSRTLEKLSEMVERLNTRGTSYSREKHTTDGILQIETSRRLIELEQAFKSQAPQLATLTSDVGWIKRHIQNGDGKSE